MAIIHPQSRHFGTGWSPGVFAPPGRLSNSHLEEGGQGAHQGPALNAPPNHPRGGTHPQGKPLGVQIYVRFTSSPRHGGLGLQGKPLETRDGRRIALYIL